MADPEKKRAQGAKWRAENPEKVRAMKAKYRVENPEIRNAERARWRAKNPERAREAWARAELARVSLLKDAYVAKALGLPVAQIPPELMELKREQIRHKRALKELKSFLTEEEEGKAK